MEAKVRSSFFTLFAAQQREELAAQQQSGQEEAVKLFDARIAAGEVSRAETLQAHLLLNQSRLQNREAQKLAAEARVTLAGALGVSVHALEKVRLSFAGLDTLPHPDERPLRRAAMLQRPDVLSSLAAYAAAEAALRLEIARQWPDLHLGPGYSYDQGQDKWTIGFTLTLPIFDQNRGPITEALAKRRQAAATFIAQQAKALSELELALASYRGALTKLETAGQLLASEERQLHSVDALFKAGENDRLTLVSAQVELQAARLSRLEALIETQQALGALEDASGLLLTP
jgi:outer membrane protein TolC